MVFSNQEEVPEEENLLALMNISLSQESIDYVRNKTQFQLHTLLTEQRHQKTWHLSETIKKDFQAGLEMLFSVDEDIEKRIEDLIKEATAMKQLEEAISDALLARQKIYIYGCGATGRLAKQMESTFWRPFWQKVNETKKIWSKIKIHLATPVEDQLIGEMTGGDRALISSLEGFEDLQLIGRLQLEDRKINKGDIVICVTEGGETSSVIGTILAALNQWKINGDYSSLQTRKKLYFVYNNPDEKLLPFNRSRRILEEKGITKINLTTGPQAITGSTRMQATTIETFVIGHILQAAIERTLRKFLSKKEMEKIGFDQKFNLEANLREFSPILQEIKKNIPSLTRLTELETKTYENGHFSTYFAKKGLITVFIDSTERSPTFRLFPLDTIKESKRKCWIQVWTSASNLQSAWQAFLGRPFRGLSSLFYKKPFEEEIEDSFLKKAALESLEQAGDEQQYLYDFSFSEFNLKNRGPQKGDLGILVLLTPEDINLREENSLFRKFTALFKQKEAEIALISITADSPQEIKKLISRIPDFNQEKNPFVVLKTNNKNDPFGLNAQTALKILLNAHSTAVMASLGKVIGNTMTNVSPSNLKLIGRATFLIQSHVNDILGRPQWVKLHGIRKQISYGEANAVLYESIKYMKNKKKDIGQTAEVALSIIRILESLRLKKRVSQDESLEILKSIGLSEYLSGILNDSRQKKIKN